jgi:hypothetical protein
MADRMRALLEAGVALTSELSLEALLQRLVEMAAELAEARYAALGVIDPSGTELERFVTTGIDAETHAAIGDGRFRTESSPNAGTTILVEVPVP